MAKMSMDKMMRECMKPHALVHSLLGLAVGFLVLGLWPALVDSALMLGVVLFVVGVVADYMVQSK